MTAKPVEWFLAVYYGLSAHRATYGRLPGNKYTKDYIQLSKRTEFVDAIYSAFPELEGKPFIPLTYRWPTGSAEGKLVRESADRPHLAWDTNNAPDPWRMLIDPTQEAAQTIRGDPSRANEQAADEEYNQLISSGFGQPYLIAVKLKGEDATLHLRVQIQNPEDQFDWADLQNAPTVIRELTTSTSKNSALAWRLFKGGPENETELYFDPDKKGNPWVVDGGHTAEGGTNSLAGSKNQASGGNPQLDSDLLAESLARSDEEISEFKSRIESDNFEVPDATSTVKTRGSAQKAFADKVKKNYDGRCALSGVRTPAFLIASHIVPWSVDQTIRLDPSNGICLSVLIDCAFEKGFIVIQDDGTVTIDLEKIGDDTELRKQLEGYHGVKLRSPQAHPPRVDYLKRRRDL